jgi:hypothetical protein
VDPAKSPRDVRRTHLDLIISFLDLLSLYQTSIMSVPSPRFKDTGKKALDEFLHTTVKDRKVPAVFLGATDKNGELYFNCGGDRVFGKPDEGQVTPDTGESRSWPTLMLLMFSPAALLDDQVHDRSKLFHFAMEVANYRSHVGSLSTKGRYRWTIPKQSLSTYLSSASYLS